jgi:hypothetical protein
MMGRIIVVTLGCLIPAAAAMAQASSLSTTLNVHVFPGAGQDEIQQSMDEAECYGWAVERTGTDPFELARYAEEQMAAADQAMAQAQNAGAGTTGRAAAGGAVAGGVIGGIFGSSSRSGWKGAAAGAATGAVIGNSRKRQGQAEAQQQVAEQSAQTQAALEAEMTNFKTAFTTCLEGKEYIAKF